MILFSQNLGLENGFLLKPNHKLKKINLSATQVGSEAMNLLSQRALSITHLDLTSCVKAVNDVTLQVKFPYNNIANNVVLFITSTSVLLRFLWKVLHLLIGSILTNSLLHYRICGVIYDSYESFSWTGVSLLLTKVFG